MWIRETWAYQLRQTRQGMLLAVAVGLARNAILVVIAESLRAGYMG